MFERRFRGVSALTSSDMPPKPGAREIHDVVDKPAHADTLP